MVSPSESSLNAISRMLPPHAGHSSGKSFLTRARSFAQAIREVSCERGLSWFGGQVRRISLLADRVPVYLYPPDLSNFLEDLRTAETKTHSAALAGDKRRTQVWIGAWEDLVRRTEVGIWIRRGSVSREMAAAETLRERIEALEHAVLDPEEIDREHVAEELKLALVAGRAHRDVLWSACPAGCAAGR
jgi:hypothetical protein